MNERVVDGKANRPAALGFIISQNISMIYVIYR
ncbi:hypothetical protein PEPTYR26121_00299 [Peptoniphilus tyrrelliae]|nr:hypothetical protein PEPTYR26121_00299 [Peptoniphilus tyrrelliae]